MDKCTWIKDRKYYDFYSTCIGDISANDIPQIGKTCPYCKKKLAVGVAEYWQ